MASRINEIMKKINNVIDPEDFKELNPDSHILTENFVDEERNKYWAKFSTKHFDSGVSRFAFKGTLRGSGPKQDTRCVVKVFRDEYAKNIDLWVPDLYTSIRAKELADEFTNDVLPMLKLKEDPVKLNFILPMLAKIDETTMTSDATNLRKNLQIANQEYVAIEEFIDGKYIKFNSNGGFEDHNLSEIMPAFTHWTWERTDRKMMVCDLQGVKEKVDGTTIYTLTDPAVHSVEESFGSTDCGTAGMYKVLGNHRCNDICRQLNLENPIKDLIHFLTIRELLLKTNTTYKFELTDAEKQMNEMEKRP